MKPMIYVAVAAFAAVAVAPNVANSDPRHCPPGLAKQGRCGDDFRDRDRDRDRRDNDWFESRHERDRVDDAYEAGYRDGARDAWRAGDRIPAHADIVVIRDYDRYGLRPPQAGYYYGQVDGEVLLIQAATQIISQAFGAY